MFQAEETVYAKALWETESIIISGTRSCTGGAGIRMHTPWIQGPLLLLPGWVKETAEGGPRVRWQEQRGEAPEELPKQRGREAAREWELGLTRERGDIKGRKQEKERVIETRIREHSRSKQRSTMLNGAMLGMQTIHWISNKEANSDQSRIVSSGLVGWSLTSLGEKWLEGKQWTQWPNYSQHFDWRTKQYGSGCRESRSWRRPEDV